MRWMVCLAVACLVAGPVDGRLVEAGPATVRLHAEVSETHEAEHFAIGGRVAVVRDGDLSESLDVILHIKGTATYDVDYTLAPIIPITTSRSENEPSDVRVHFEPGQRFARVFIKPIDDDVGEGPESVRLELKAADGYQLGPPSTRSVVITIAGEVSRSARSNGLVIGPSDRQPDWVGDMQVSAINVDEADLPFSKATEILVGSHTNPWDAGAVWRLPRTFSEGDEVLVCFFAKGTRSDLPADNAPARLTVRLQVDGGNYDGEEQTFDLTGRWRPYLFRVTMSSNLPLGRSSLSFRLGHGRQRIALADWRLWNFGRGWDFGLPKPIHSYEGRDVDAAWRTERASSDKTQYEIGTAVNAKWVSPSAANAGAGRKSTTSDAERYRSIVLRYFDRITDENSQQWAMWVNNPAPATEMAAWAVRNKLKLRGHSVMWGDPVGWPSPPDLWKTYQRTLESEGEQAGVFYLRNRVAEHVRNNSLVGLNGTIGDSDRPIISEWDVVNHPILYDQMWDITGWEFLRAAIREARTLAHPATKFFINEDQVLSSPTHQNAAPLASVVEQFIDHQVPIDGIGFQSHFKSQQLPSIDGIGEVLDRFAAYGWQLHITEFDIDNVAIDDQTQADFTRDFLDLCAAHPAVTAFIVWGFWEGEHWRSSEGAAMWTTQWKLRPHGQVLLDHIALEKSR
ncbi:Endo-1,4-beta-xylanase A [Neorhodopirellula pilleata]|uniref:Beta-xylanase n=2 Tax=Neorhodopirellula pilleata TaxID=2714738 RepID=A0A5C6A1A2_9BACT|nr:Endo-1,4-beta-xylanase A [Neorhodopirellula pilleata]